MFALQNGEQARITETAIPQLVDQRSGLIDPVLGEQGLDEQGAKARIVLAVLHRLQRGNGCLAQSGFFGRTAAGIGESQSRSHRSQSRRLIAWIFLQQRLEESER